MSILSRLKQAAVAAKRSMFSEITTTSLPNGVLEFQRRFGKAPDVSQAALVQRYWGWTYACVQLTAARFASTPLKLYAARGRGQSRVKNFATNPVDRKQQLWLRQRTKSLANIAGAEDFEEITEHPLLDLLQNINDNENSY